MQNLKLHIATWQLSSVLLAATVYLLESYLAGLHKSNPASTNYEDSCEMQGEELKAVESVEITSKRTLRFLCCGGVSPLRCGFFHCQNEILWFLGKLRDVIRMHFIVIYLTHYTFPVPLKIFFCLFVSAKQGWNCKGTELGSLLLSN